MEKILELLEHPIFSLMKDAALTIETMDFDSALYSHMPIYLLNQLNVAAIEAYSLFFSQADCLHKIIKILRIVKADILHAKIFTYNNKHQPSQQ